MIFELEKVLARVGDGHTGVFLPFNGELELDYLPLRLMGLNDAQVVTNAEEKYRHLIGQKLIKIENKSIEDLFHELKDYIPHDNKYGQKGTFTEYLLLADLLKYIGLPASENSIRATFEHGSGEPSAVELEFITKQQFGQLSDTILLGANQEPLPLWLRQDCGKFWKERIEGDILYIQLNSSDIGGLEDKMVQFSRELIEEVSDESIKKVVLDLRRNSGGSIWRTYPLLRAMIAIDQVYPGKKLFVCIGNDTFSAANVIATQIDLFTEAVFIGMPTGGKPNGVGDIGRIKLPSLDVTIRYSRLHTKPSSEWDARPSIFPGYKAPVSYRQFFEGKDPALEIIRNFKEKKDLSPVLRPYLEKGDVRQLILVYQDKKQNQYNQYHFNEEVLNRLAIQLYRDEKVEEAIQVLEFNAREYPWWPNAHSNLGALYLETGKREKGKEHLKKAFELHKGYTHWRDVVNKN